MKVLIGISLVASAIALPVTPANAQDYESTNPNNCPARGQPGRTECLNRMLGRGDVINERANAELARLTKRMEAACSAAQVADSAARRASRSPNVAVNAVGRVWTSARALADFALGQRRECEKLRRELRGR
jgi:hypothetical protein